MVQLRGCHHIGPYPVVVVLQGTAALGTQDVLLVGQEALTDERDVTAVTAEAVRMPMAVVERDELRTAKSGDGLSTATTLLGKQLPEAVGAVGLVLTGGELLTSQHLLTVGALEAVAMEGGALIGDATLVDHAIAAVAALGELILVAGHANELGVTWDEALVADWLLADVAAEALLVPLLATELKLLHAGTEDVTASVTARSKVVVMAVSTVEFLVLGGKGLIDEGSLAVAALKARLMPMLVLVRQVLGVGTDGHLALLTGVGEEVLIAFDAEGVVVAQDVAMAGQRQVAVPARKVPRVEVLIHRFGVLTRKYQRSFFDLSEI